jgi:hypothetical protein
LLDLRREFVEQNLSDMLPEISFQVRFRRFHAGRLLVYQNLLFPGVREVLDRNELTRPVVEGIDSREDWIQKALSDAFGFQLGNFSQDYGPFDTLDRSVCLNNVLTPPADENRRILSTKDYSSCLVPAPGHRDTLAR